MGKQVVAKLAVLQSTSDIVPSYLHGSKVFFHFFRNASHVGKFWKEEDHSCHLN